MGFQGSQGLERRSSASAGCQNAALTLADRLQGSDQLIRSLGSRGWR